MKSYKYQNKDLIRKSWFWYFAFALKDKKKVNYLTPGTSYRDGYAFTKVYEPSNCILRLPHKRKHTERHIKWQRKKRKEISEACNEEFCNFLSQ